jgi:hypothetical protein
MPASARRLAADPATDPVVAEIEALGFRYNAVPQFDLTKLSDKARIQVRDTRNYAPKDMVERFAAQMASSKFPPIVVTSDYWLVDGNTRTAAAAKRRQMFFPALVLDVAWESATTRQRDELFALAATLNSRGGKPLESKERREVAARFIALGWRADQIARYIGVPVTRLAGIKRQIEAETRLRKVGADPAKVEKKLNVLGSATALALNDEPYRQLAAIIPAADLTATETESLARRMKDSGSDSSALALVAATEREMADRIRQTSLTGRGKPPASAMARKFLGNVTKYEGRERELVELNPDAIQLHKETLRRAIAVLQAVLKEQDRR